jgi:hypothetical protein
MQLAPAQLAGRLALLALGAAALVTGVLGGLGRLGLSVPAPLANATALHGALMIGGFLGTVIGIERAVALGHRIGFVGPLASGIGGLALVAGEVQAGAWLLVFASAVHVAVTTRLALRQVAQHTLMLIPASAAWLVASLLFALGVSAEGMIAWGFDFLLFTIAAERLDMARLVKRKAYAGPLLVAACGAVLVASAWIVVDPRAGGALYGAALIAMAAWFAVFDVARRTVRTHGLGQYAAACILGGYAWLAVAGVAWFGMAALGWPTRDLALHALGLGFVMSMIFGHAPIIAPAVARVKCAFGAWFYLAPAALYASLLVRFVPGFDDAGARAWGGLLNVAALLVFAATMARSIQVGFRIFPRPKRPPPGYVHEHPTRQRPS